MTILAIPAIIPVPGTNIGAEATEFLGQMPAIRTNQMMIWTKRLVILVWRRSKWRPWSRKLVDENQQLKSKKPVLLPKLVKTSGGKLDKHDPYVPMIRNVLKAEVWRTNKFVTSDKQQVAFANDVLDSLELEEAKDAQWRQEWINEYAPICTRDH